MKVPASWYLLRALFVFNGAWSSLTEFLPSDVAMTLLFIPDNRYKAFEYFFA